MSRSWSREPFVDIKVIYRDPNDDSWGNRGNNCPQDYPEDVIYNFWPGATVGCDCLDVDGERQITAGKLCDTIKTRKEIKREKCKDI